MQVVQQPRGTYTLDVFKGYLAVGGKIKSLILKLLIHVKTYLISLVDQIDESWTLGKYALPILICRFSVHFED